MTEGWAPGLRNNWALGFQNSSIYFNVSYFSPVTANWFQSLHTQGKVGPIFFFFFFNLTILGAVESLRSYTFYIPSQGGWPRREVTCCHHVVSLALNGDGGVFFCFTPFSCFLVFPWADCFMSSVSGFRSGACWSSLQGLTDWLTGWLLLLQRCSGICGMGSAELLDRMWSHCRGVQPPDTDTELACRCTSESASGAERKPVLTSGSLAVSSVREREI